MITLARILLYPIKSLNGTSVDRATLLLSGSLEHDRRYAVIDMDGNVVNGKRTAKVHRLRCKLEFTSGMVSLGTADASQVQSFQIDDQRREVNDWFSRFFEMSVQLAEDGSRGFPDDTDAPGPTIASIASLAEVARWFSDLTVDECRGRFRANLEFEGTEPFWEDHLFSEAGSPVRFSIGSVVIEGARPCQRCVVPSRSAQTGETTPGFQRTFAERRKKNLGSRVAPPRFDHYYRFAVNTR
ncbi:MAG: MOSC domain-containing protein, partial [Pirellulaceae bacterium]